MTSTTSRISPLGIDHICLLVANINTTRIYLESLFDFIVRQKPGHDKVLMVENGAVHFFVKECSLATPCQHEQHISFEVADTSEVRNRLERSGIKSYSEGEFNHFKGRNYRWIEWRDENGIRFECVETSG